MNEFVTGQMTLPAGVAVKAAKIEVGVFEISNAKRAKGFKYLIFRGVWPAVDDRFYLPDKIFYIYDFELNFISPVMG